MHHIIGIALTIILAATFALPSAAFADRDLQMIFQTMDENQDNMVDIDEYRKHRDEVNAEEDDFDKMDADKSETLDEDEWSAYHQNQEADKMEE